MVSTCEKDGCGTRPSYAANAKAKRPNFCAKHAPKGWIRLRATVNRLCAKPECPKWSSFGVVGSKNAEFCVTHALAGMVDVRGRTCKHDGCGTRPTYGVPGTKKAEFCSKHVRAGMMNVITRRCLQPHCNITPSFGLHGSISANFCAQHAMDGMVNLRSKTCVHPGCKITASFGAKGNQARRFCAEHASDGMTNKILSPAFRRRRKPAPVVDNAVDSAKQTTLTTDATGGDSVQNTEGAGSAGGIPTRAMDAHDVSRDEGGETTESEMEEGEEENGNRAQAPANDVNAGGHSPRRPTEEPRAAAVVGEERGHAGGGADRPSNSHAGANEQSLASRVGAGTDDEHLASGKNGGTSDPESSFEPSPGADREQHESPAGLGKNSLEFFCNQTAVAYQPILLVGALFPCKQYVHVAQNEPTICR